MPGAHTSRRASLAVAALGLLALAGCDVKAGRADLVNGKRQYVAKCGSCHVLERAGTNGVTGPDLDEAFRVALADGMGRGTVRGIVEEQILYPAANSKMPAGLVKGANAADVAAYVAAVAAKPGEDTGALVLGPTSGPGAVFVRQGCGSCHTFAAAQSSGTTGPNLDEVLDGQSPAQILESIVSPDAEITPGFQRGVMPGDYGQKMSRQELQALARWLAEQRR